MRRKHLVAVYVVAVICLLLISLSSIQPRTSTLIANATDTVTLDSEESWIIEWKAQPSPLFRKESVILREYPDSNVVVAKPLSHGKESAWQKRWSNSDQVISVQPNQTLQVAQMPNDPMLSHQKYLQQIGMPEAWDMVTGNPNMVIAVVDTGIELAHPDLAPVLTQGINLVNPGKSPEDDNGHGTNVAGVIAAVAGNEKGVSGILWEGKIMPIKALEADGTGDEDMLGEGIRYAVNHGADIIVLSLGLNKPSTYMESVIRYAESEGVLLVAASGNEGKEVKYPAAYPTVLAVGGIMEDNTKAVLSNYGMELDLVAPWNVFTTSSRGTYNFSGGTSLAAPQVAAVAALVMSVNPELEPFEVRSLLRETAESLDGAGWNKDTGYGLVRADHAVAAAQTGFQTEGSKYRSQASILPLNKQTDGILSGSSEELWYKLEVPYAGFVDLEVNPAKQMKDTTIVLYQENQSTAVKYTLDPNGQTTLSVNKGTYWIALRKPSSNKASTVYHITPMFRMKSDPFEGNDRSYQAYMLPARDQSLTGTFHQSGDTDWYSLRVDRPGKMNIKASTTSNRIDLTLLMKRAEETGTIIDRQDEGMPEQIDGMEVTPGLYFIQVGSIERSDYPPTGEYTLTINYESRYPDPREPNDKPYQASDIKADYAYNGAINQADDVDWFRFRVAHDSKVELVVINEIRSTDMKFILTNASLETLEASKSSGKKSSVPIREQSITTLLKPGVYYVKITAKASAESNNGAYLLKLHLTEQ